MLQLQVQQRHSEEFLVQSEQFVNIDNTQKNHPEKCDQTQYQTHHQKEYAALLPPLAQNPELDHFVEEAVLTLSMF